MFRLFGSAPRTGDWIKTTERVPVSLTDMLSDSGIPSGTRGVVTEVSGLFGSHLVARIDDGLFAPTTVRVRTSQVRVTRRGGGIDAFTRRTRLRTRVRLGATILVLALLIWFLIPYVAIQDSEMGFVSMMIVGSARGILDLIEFTLNHPAQGLVHGTIIWIALKLTFGRW